MSIITETHKRTITRMITYRLTAWLMTCFWTYLFLKDVSTSFGFSTILHALLTIDYYFHERVWLKIKWGIEYK